jgi:hypothetical protein
MSTGCVKRARREVEAIREVFVDDVDVTDPTMVSEYSEDIFAYMEELEVIHSRLVVLGYLSDTSSRST